MHILNVYLEPGHEGYVVKRADNVISLARGIIRQDPAAKIMLGGDLNGQLGRLHTALTQAGFTPALRGGSITHKEGNQLDQMWARNIRITNAIVADRISQVSNHCQIQVKIKAVLTSRQQVPALEPEEVDPRSLPQTTVRKVIKKCLENGTFDTTPFIDSRPLIDYVPQEVIRQHKPQSKRGR